MSKKKILVPVDENVKIPASVKAAAAKSDELHKAVYAAPDPVDPPADPPAEPAPEGSEPPVTPVVAAPPAEPPAPIAPPAPPPDDWEHRYNSMKGRFERAERDNRTLIDRLNGLEGTLASIQAQPAPTPPPEPVAPLLTPKEEEDYGRDFLDVVGRKAREQLTPEIASVRQQLEELKNRVGNVGEFVAQDARSRMQTVLDQRVPNWREINNNERFLNWLALPDTYSGAIKHNLLKQAYAANDTPRVLAFFEGFLSEEAALSPPAPTPGPTPPPAAPKVPLEQLAAPGRAKTAAAPPVAPAEKPYITRAQITQLYKDRVAGKYAGRDDEFRGLERMIHEAQREGRIV